MKKINRRWIKMNRMMFLWKAESMTKLMMMMKKKKKKKKMMKNMKKKRNRKKLESMMY